MYWERRICFILSIMLRDNIFYIWFDDLCWFDCSVNQKITMDIIQAVKDATDNQYPIHQIRSEL